MTIVTQIRSIKYNQNNLLLLFYQESLFNIYIYIYVQNFKRSIMYDKWIILFLRNDYV